MRFNAWVNINALMPHHITRANIHFFALIVVQIYGILIRYFDRLDLSFGDNTSTQRYINRRTAKKNKSHNMRCCSKRKKQTAAAAVVHVSQINISCYAIMTANKDGTKKKCAMRRKIALKIINGKLGRKLLFLWNSVKGDSLIHIALEKKHKHNFCDFNSLKI